MNEFQPVTQCFRQQIKDRLHPAAQLAVIHQGRLVVDLAAAQENTPPVDAHTPFLTFSVSKAFTACAILRLFDEGKLDLDAPVGTYWPEFAHMGKETATIRHALLHQAGVPAPHLYAQIFTWPFWPLVTSNLAREKALYPPGTQTAYHLVNFGFILGEVVRRVSGMPVDIYLKRTFFDPMGLQNTWMRIPARELKRSPRLVTGSKNLRSTSQLFNLPVIRRSLLPAAGLHSTARELATFFQMLLDGGEYAGQRFLQPDTVALATRSHYDGYDQYIRTNMNWGLGFIIGGGQNTNQRPGESGLGTRSSSSTFSAMGMGGCGMVWADRQARLVTAFTCNGMLDNEGVGERWSAISNTVWSSLAGSN